MIVILDLLLSFQGQEVSNYGVCVPKCPVILEWENIARRNTHHSSSTVHDFKRQFASLERQPGSRPLETNSCFKKKCRCSMVYCIYYCSYIFVYVFLCISVFLVINHKNVYTIVLFSRYIYLYTPRIQTTL